jgi:ribulose kinase
MAYVFGTSAGTMSSSATEAFVPGVWGPYYNVFSPVSTELAKTQEIRFKAFEALQAAARIARSGS